MLSRGYFDPQFFSFPPSRLSASPHARGGLRLLLVIVSAAVLVAASQDPVSRDLAAAAAAEKAGNYAAAATCYRRVLAEARQNDAALAGARIELAKDYFFLRRYEESLAALKPSLDASLDQQTPAAAQAALVAGMDNLELNRLPAAADHLRRALALNPESGTARLALGDVYARSNRLEQAAHEYREQLRQTPSVADGWYKLGIVYSDLSGETVRGFIARAPENPVVLQLTAERLLEKGDAAGALHVLLSVARANWGQPGLRADIGIALLDLGHVRLALEQFQAELSDNPESPPALLGLAEASALEGNWSAAFTPFLHLIRFQAQALDQELESSPPKPLSDAWQQGRLKLPARWASTPAGKLWTRWLANSGTEVQIDAAENHAACISLPTRLAQTPGFWLTTACYQRLRSKLDRQKHSGTAGLAELAKLAEADFRLGRYESSRADAEALLERQPSNGWAVYWLARSYDALAGDCFQKLPLLSPGSARVHEILAQLDASHFQWSRAEDEYKSAIRLAPGLPDLHLGLGTVYWQAGDWVQSESELEETLKLDPASRVANYELGDCKIQQHEWPAAIPYLRQAIPDPAVRYRARLDLAQAEAATGNEQGAIEDLLPVAGEDQDGVLHYQLALLYRKLGELDQAREAIAQSQDLRRSSAQQAEQQIEQAEQELRKVEVSSPAGKN